MAARTALVTGGARGLGLGIAARLADDGFEVILGDLEIDTVTASATTLGATPVEMDVTDDESVRRAFDVLGGRPLDVLVNNAGTIARQPSHELDLESWERELAVNLTGTVRCSRAAFAHLVRSSSACILNLASVGSTLGLPQRAGYSTTKSGLVGLTRTLAAEWGPDGIRVNAIAPGYIRTAMMASGLASGALDPARLLDRTPLRRLGTIEEVAAAAAFLVSDDASFVTGATLAVDGGITIDGGFHARPYPEVSDA